MRICNRCGDPKPDDRYRLRPPKGVKKADASILYKTHICLDCEFLASKLYRWKKNGGVTLEQYAESVEKQGGRCKICDTVPKTPLVVDHCHVNGHFRGCICNGCNLGLGNFGDNPRLVERALTYLQDDRQRQLAKAVDAIVATDDLDPS